MTRTQARRIVAGFLCSVAANDDTLGASFEKEHDQILVELMLDEAAQKLLKQSGLTDIYHDREELKKAVLGDES